jgi:hypothetical protein
VNIVVCLAELIVVPLKLVKLTAWQASQAVVLLGMCTGESTASFGV